jgi:hypothetical protein
MSVVPHVELFLLLPETTPTHSFIKKNDGFQSNEEVSDYLKELSNSLKSISTENYIGYYDSENITNYLEHYEILDEFYPLKPKRVLSALLKEFYNWREVRISAIDESASLFFIPITNDSFCEALTRKHLDRKNLYLFVSHNALSKKFVLLSFIFRRISHSIDVSELTSLFTWFSRNRVPKRNYHPSPKHGENGRGEQKGESKLLCTHNQAKELLNTSIGIQGYDELYNYDETVGKYIIFRYEGDNPLNQFHAYHIDNINDVPDEIKKRFHK